MSQKKNIKSSTLYFIVYFDLIEVDNGPDYRSHYIPYITALYSLPANIFLRYNLLLFLINSLLK